MRLNDRNTWNKGGGVLLYAKYNLDPVQFVPQTKFPEHAWCKVKSEDGIELFIGVCYNSNNGKIFGNDTHLLLRQLLCEVSQYHVLIMGAFNYPDIDWETIAATDRAPIHCESKKTRQTLAHNFTKYLPISKILSLLDSVGNL